MGGGVHRMWSGMVRQIVIPEAGLTLDGFADLMKIEPWFAEPAGRYLHRRKLLWLSEQRGHIRVYPASMIPGRGRPLGVLRQQSLIPTQISGLMIDLLPSMGSIAMLLSKMPTEGWQDDPALQADLRRAMEVESHRVMKLVRKFVGERGYPIGMLRKYLWMLAPTGVMEVVIRTHPDLAISDEPLSPVVEDAPKKIEANLPAEERVMRYVNKAGVEGIAVYEIATKTNGKIKRAEIEDIAGRLEDSGMLYVAEARVSNRGPKGLRLYSRKLGKPIIGSDGRRLQPLRATA